ncbi:ABC transporter substrate-binding protein [Micromonospora sp. CA-263727]|uniref:ABC transporter substrate-binding protein n=1 Tax=Micromonospora sp. CA-263727 TaxID=3239967 RepID=UPI003D8B0CE9
MRKPRSRSLVAGLAVSLFTLPIAACSTETTDRGADGQAAVTLVAAADPSLLPYNFLDTDGKTWKGINVDLAAALSEKLGSTITFQSAGFDTIVPGLAAGRFDLALTGMFDTLERQKTVDFVDYLAAKNNFLTLTTFRDVASMDDLCGVRVGIPGGALESTLLADASAECVKAGKPAIDVNEFADLDATVLALRSGRIDVTPNDSAANAYINSQNKDTMKVSGGYLNEGYFAAAFPKNSELAKKVEAAFSEIIDDGTYAGILREWGVEDRALEAPIINGATF